MKFFNKIVTLSLLAMLSINYSCSAQSLFGPKFSAYVLVAPEKRLAGVKKVAIMRFDNQSSHSEKQSGTDLGSKFGDYITEMVIRENRLGGGYGAGGIAPEDKIFINGAKTNIYNLVERSQLDKVLQEQSFNVSGAVDDTQAVEVGKILGVDAMVLGSLSYTYKDEESNKQFKDKNNQVYTIYSLTRTVVTEARMKIIDVKTAQILGTMSKQVSTIDSKSDRKKQNLNGIKTVVQLADEGLHNAAPAFADYFCPYFEFKRFDIENIKVRALKNRAKEAKEYLKDGKVDKAFPLYKAIYEEDSYNPKAAYNVGTIYEVIGNFDKAFECYQVATDLEPSDNGYSRAFKRAAAGKKLLEDFKELGIEITPKIMRAAGSGALADKVETEGSSSDRVTIYSEPNRSSSSIAKIPGGIKLSVIEKAEDWYFVKLPVGDKEGYIHKDDIDEE